MDTFRFAATTATTATTTSKQSTILAPRFKPRVFHSLIEKSHSCLLHFISLIAFLLSVEIKIQLAVTLCFHLHKIQSNADTFQKELNSKIC